MPRGDHLTHEQFHDLTQHVSRLITRYWGSLESRPVLSRVRPGDILAAMPDAAPEEPAPLDAAALDELDRLIQPGLTHWQSPHFYAFFPSTISGPSVLAEFLCAGLGLQGMLWATSPACTEVEMRVLDWLGRAIGLPESFLFGASPASAAGGGVIQGTASDAVLAALVAARRRTLWTLPPEQRRAALPRLTAYTSTQAHSSVLKAAMVAGLAIDPDDREQLRLVPTRGDYSMDPEALGAMVRADLAAGRLPCFVSATIGTTSSTAVDPLDEIAAALAPAAAARPWLHVDAAHSGSALVCPEMRWMLQGIEHADSFCFNPHKWLLTNFDCNCFWTRDRASLTGAMSVTPEYLRNAASDAGAVVDYRDWHVPLGRRFRALKLWCVLRHYGLSGLRAFIREHLRLAGLFESWVAAESRLELCAPRTVNLVCFRPRPAAGESPGGTDARTKALLDRLNATGRVYLTHTVLPATSAAPARLVLRLAIGAVQTTERHVREAWALIVQHL